MKGDFSRETFDSKKHFSRVLMQQGRVLLDADWNEQSAILLHYIRTLAADLIGPHAGPGDGFKVAFDKDGKDILITPGHYYVDGILCENNENNENNVKFGQKPVSYFNQPHYRLKSNEFPKGQFLVYLDVWERHITHFEDKGLREVALGGVDTTTRSQVVWQVKILETDSKTLSCESVPPVSSGLLVARAKQDRDSEDPCVIEPDARYRGAENQLYRVEIHTGNMDQNEKTPTFKWSRENGTVVFPVISIDAATVSLTSFGRDERFSLCEGDWVELIDDEYILHGRAGNLLRIEAIDRDEMLVTLSAEPKIPISNDPNDHPLLRRWDQKAGNPSERGLTLNSADNAAEIRENEWLILEDGVEIQFSHPKETKPAGKEEKPLYRTGDYWLIPARTATGDIEWPQDSSGPIAQSARGVKHHYAPLGIFAGGKLISECRCTMHSGTACPPRNGREKPKVADKAKPKAGNG